MKHGTTGAKGSAWIACHLLAAACSGDYASQPELLGETSFAIIDGEVDPDQDAVLAVVSASRQSEALCTGTLIAPNLVLTARHCLASDPIEEGVDCTNATLTELQRPRNVFVTASAEVTGANFYPVSGIEVTGGAELCGADIALLILGGQFTDLDPIPPRLDQPVETGELFAAVGYGESLEPSSSGTRRRSDDLAVLCTAEECDSDQVTAMEFVVEQGVCVGDSGGPALTVDSEVVGVASRTSGGCGVAVYAALHPWAEWIREVGETAFEAGDYAAPAWLDGTTLATPAVRPADELPTASSNVDGESATSPPPLAQVPTEDLEDALSTSSGTASGCSTSVSGPPSKRRALWPWFGLLGLLGLARRRRASVANPYP